MLRTFQNYSRTKLLLGNYVEERHHSGVRINRPQNPALMNIKIASIFTEARSCPAHCFETGVGVPTQNAWSFSLVDHRRCLGRLIKATVHLVARTRTKSHPVFEFKTSEVSRKQTLASKLAIFRVKSHSSMIILHTTHQNNRITEFGAERALVLWISPLRQL